MVEADKETVDEGNDELRQLLSLSKIPDPTSIDLSLITKLDLFQGGLSSLPSGLEISLPNLSILFCMKNKFVIVPEIIGKCQKLQMVSFKSNQIRSIHPEALQPQMRWLILTDNKITCLPKTIGRCTKLQKFMLSGNLIEEVPSEISACENLELIRLASNKLKEPPMELLNLPRLSWVALSDNPFLKETMLTNSADDQEMHLQTFDDDRLDDVSLGVELGKGASGITRKYTADFLGNNNNCVEEVAVKEYFSTITSDGNPQEERKVSTVASSLGCKSLVKVLGKTKKGNLVMELLKNYTVIANPPSLQSCSRDVYKIEDIIDLISAKRVLSVVGHLLHALMKLHSQGICHGDFYGHNILISNNNEDDVWLTDFGAAFFYDQSSEYGKAIENIERRAFYHFVAEMSSLLVSIKDTNNSKSGAMKKLHEIACYCNFLTFDELFKKWSEI